MRMNSINILLHNVSHSDIQFSLRSTCTTSKLDLETVDFTQTPKINYESNSLLVARPKFNHFREITSLILNFLENDDNKFTIAKSIKHFQLKNEVMSSNPYEYIPVGFDILKNENSLRFSKSSWRFQDDYVYVDANELLTLESICFPLLAILIPKWLESIHYNPVAKSNCQETHAIHERQLILFLVTGRGSSTNSTSRNIDNSTKITGALMTKFIQLTYPFIRVTHIHSSTNIFRYDENIVFVKRELLPSIDILRDQLINDLLSSTSTEQLKWKDYFRLTISFADGSSARVSAINASLKHYRPDYMHFWQLKRYWKNNILCVDDVEWHSYEEISTETAMSVEATCNTLEGEVIQEMLNYIKDYNQIQENKLKNDLGTFWLRKTKKVVLAVLLVQKFNGDKKFYRGCNMEVSMPTGSLCAERNAIGSALADDLTLCRRDLKMIAVYSPSSLDSKSNIVDTTNTNTNITATSTTAITSNIINSKLDENQLKENSSGTSTQTPRRPLMSNSDQIISVANNITIANDRIESNSLHNEINIHNVDNNCNLNLYTPDRSDILNENSQQSNYSLQARSQRSRSHSQDIHTQNSPNTTFVGQKRRIMNQPLLDCIPNTSDLSNLSGPLSSRSRSNSIHRSYSNGNLQNTSSSSKSLFQSVLQQPFNLINSGSKSLLHKSERPSELPSSGNKRHDINNIVLKDTLYTKPEIHIESSSFLNEKIFIPHININETALSSNLTPLPLASHTSNEITNNTNILNRSTTRRLVTYPTETGLTSLINSSTNTNSHSYTNTASSINSNNIYSNKVKFDMSNIENFSNDDDDEFPCQCHMNDNYHNNEDEITNSVDESLAFANSSRFIEVDDSDMNPIKPCGACLEWLKKISEVNPRFAVITFTDVHCHGVYIEQIKE